MTQLLGKVCGWWVVADSKNLDQLWELDQKVKKFRGHLMRFKRLMHKNMVGGAESAPPRV